MTLTTRLSLFFLAAIAVVLVGFSAALYAIADTHLHRRADEQLEAAAQTLASSVELEPGGVEWEPVARPLTLGPGVFGNEVRWAVTTDDGQVIERSQQPGAESLLADAEQAARTGRRSLRRLDHAGSSWQITQLRVVANPAPPTAPTLPVDPTKPQKYPALVLTVAIPLGPVYATLRMLAVALVGLTVVVLAVGTVGSRAVCRRALSPVTQMAGAARMMGAADLAERLPVSPVADELTDLGRAFNGLLDRLGTSFERERRFTGEASHQLRTPLTALIGQAEVALRRDRSPDEYRRALDSVLALAGQLRRVVEALLFLARAEADAELPGLERVDLAAWVPGRARCGIADPRAADMTTDPSPDGPVWAMIHPELFGELMDILIDNAFKYSHPGTPVVVRTGRDAAGPWVEVEDRGCGIEAEDIPHLFRPFFRSPVARRLGIPGSGLGLAVAARVAAALGGTIEVQSAPDRGSRFRVHLPPADRPLPMGDDAHPQNRHHGHLVPGGVRAGEPLTRRTSAETSG